MTDEKNLEENSNDQNNSDSQVEASPAQDGAVEAESQREAASASDQQQEQETSELEQVSAQAAEYLEGWQRARAELANYKKRVERERRDSYQRAAADILIKQLEILDDLERALEDRPEDGPAASWAEGIEMVHRKFVGLLENHNIETIEAAGEPFDPNLHEAISHEEVDDVAEGYVIDVVKPGYRMGDRVLRPAVVRVAK